MLTDEEAMALAVLKGDLTAARALADKLCEHCAAGESRLMPTRTITGQNVKALVYMKESALVADSEAVLDRVVRWLWGGGTSAMSDSAAVDRIELYEFPEPASLRAPQESSFRGPTYRG